MAQLLVRNIDEKIVRALKMRAARRGRSAEAEHRQILYEVLIQPKRSSKSLKELLQDMPHVGNDEDFERVRDMGREVGDCGAKIGAERSDASG